MAEHRNLLDVEGLSVWFRVRGREVAVVRDATFHVAPGEVLGLVGESGSGKTMTSMAILGLVGHLGGRVEGRMHLDGIDLTTCGEREMRRLRGRRIGMVFQQPTRALDPAFTIGDQIAETVRHNLGLSRRDAWARAVELLDRVHIPDAARRAREYPHTFSGGMCQRAMIAMALSCEPDLLIADEPTTALDVSVQARIVTLIRELQEDLGLGVLYITHDLGVVARVADRVTAMYAGEVVESSPREMYFTQPRHPYSEGLMRAASHRSGARRLHTISGSLPAVDNMPDGCRFEPRCPYAAPGCAVSMDLQDIDEVTAVRCARADEVTLQGAI